MEPAEDSGYYFFFFAAFRFFAGAAFFAFFAFLAATIASWMVLYCWLRDLIRSTKRRNAIFYFRDRVGGP